MKRYLAILSLLLALLLTLSACAGKTAPAETPSDGANEASDPVSDPAEPSGDDPVPVTPDPAEPAPVDPTEPDTLPEPVQHDPPEGGGPEVPPGAVPIAFEDPADLLALWRGGVWLNEEKAALIRTSENGLVLKIFSMPDCTLLQEYPLPGSEGYLMGLDLPAEGPWRLAYYNGRIVRQLVLDEKLVLTESAYDEADYFRMGEHVVTGAYPDILLDGEVILKGNVTAEPYSERHGVFYGLIGVLDEHRFVFGNYDTYTPNYYSVYDIDTGEEQMICPMGTYLCGVWNGVGIRAVGNGLDDSYGFVSIDMADYSVRPIAVEHSARDQAVQQVEFNMSGTRMALTTDRFSFGGGEAGQTVDIYDTAGGPHLYTWTWSSSGDEGNRYYRFVPVGEDVLTVEYNGGEDAVEIWYVKY